MEKQRLATGWGPYYMDFYLHICNDIVTVGSHCYLAHYTLDVGCNAQNCPYNMGLSWRYIVSQFHTNVKVCQL